jgi:4-hydroxy-tetrahydrodipicolinate synthase
MSFGRSWRVFLASADAFLMQTRADHRVQEYTDLAMAGEVARAREIRNSLEPVRHALRSSRPVGKTQAQFKYWQELLGQAGGPVRPPLLQLTGEERAGIREAFDGCGLGRRAQVGALA